MPFRSSPANGAFRIAAGLLVVALGVGMIVSPGAPSRLFGSVLALVGLFIAAVGVAQNLIARRQPRDPYDLSKLWDQEPEPEEPEDERERDLVYCHHCGASMQQAYAICPQCGSRLGG